MTGWKGYLLFFLAWLGLVAATAWTQPVGASYFAIQGYNSRECNIALKVFDGVKTPAVAVLWKSFDTHKICLQRFIKRFANQPHIIEIHFSNEAGRRNRRLAKYEFLPHFTVTEYNRALIAHDAKTLQSIRSNADDISQFIHDFGTINTNVLVSTGLEDDLSYPAWRVLAATIRNQLPPRFLLVRSPQRNYETHNDTNDIINAIELHGFYPAWTTFDHCIANNDGSDIDFKSRWPEQYGNNSLNYTSLFNHIEANQWVGCLIFLWWSGGQSASARFTEPRRRSFRLYFKDVHLINRLLRKYSK